jgi:diguanylate cyclase (GGDEF)-like protein
MPLRMPRRLARRVLAVQAVGAALVVGAILRASHERFAGWLPLVMIAGLSTLAHVGIILVRDGGSRRSLAWRTTVLVLGLVALPAGQLILAVVAGRAFAALLQREQPQKAGFNTAVVGIEAGVASGIVSFAHVHEAVLVWQDVFTPMHLASLAAGTLLAADVSLLLVTAVSSAERGRRSLPELAKLHGPSVLVWARNFLAALVIAAALGRSAVIAGIVAIALVPTQLVTSDRAALKRERFAWHRLQVAIDQLRDVELDELVREATRAAATMMRADAAEIELDVRTGHATRLRASDIAEPHRPDDGDAQHQFTMDVELSTLEGRVGTLRLLFARPVTLTATEKDTLASFANALAVALANAMKLDAIRRDADERVKAAYIDPVTGLGNLLKLEDEAAPAIASLADGQVFAIAVIGLDRFAEVNDLLGAHAADQMLRAVAQRLGAVIRRCDVVGRLHGAEYVLLLRELISDEAAVAQAELAVRSLGRAITAEGLDITLDAHTGVACAPTDGEKLSELVRRARLAMYKARSTDVPVYRYHAELEPPALAQVEMLRDLSAALNEHQLILHYQPKFDLRGGFPTAAEALVRWEHPERGMIPPAEFIPLLERCGLVGNLTRYVLEAAIKECSTWYKSGMQLSVAVNLSARNLLDEELPGFVLGCLGRYGLPADRLICEITETAVFSRSPVASSILDQLRAAGIALSLDDFCTGYSSLSLLQERTIDEIKIDRSFVKDMEVGNRTTEIVKALIELAHRCDIIVTAEGIETPEQQQLLTTLGCDYAQGYLLARPMPEAAVRTFFADTMKALPITPIRRRMGRKLRFAGSFVSLDDASGFSGSSD